MTETQQRFLRAIAERVPVDQVVELHLFPPIRQGGVETGVAVVAEDPRPPLPNVDPTAPEGVTEPIAAEPAAAGAVTDVVVTEPGDELPRDGDQNSAAAAGDSATSTTFADAEVEIAHASEVRDVPADDAAADADDDRAVAQAPEESPYADDESAEDDSDARADEGETSPAGAAESNGRGRPAPLSRYTIHTARYRLTLKGVDRGKWEVDVVAEADAPLEAVDAVVRGVQRRAGEGAEPDRLNAEAFRGALEAPLATLER